MGKVTGSWERPIQGVSQQTDKDRINGQCTLQENFIPSPLYGLLKRIGTRYISKLMASVSNDSFWYHYVRGDDEAYFVLIEPNKYPRVFDMLGREKVVNAVEVEDAYVKVAKPVDTFTLSTVADYTFVANKDVTVKKGTDKERTNPSMAIVYLQYATYGRDYIIKANGKEIAKYRTPNGDNAKTDPPFVRTNFIIEELAKQVANQAIKTVNKSVIGTADIPFVTLDETPVSVLNCYNITRSKDVRIKQVDGANVYLYKEDGNALNDVIKVTYQVQAATDYNVEVHGNTMYITRKDGTSFDIETVDSASGNDLVAVQDKVRQLVNLPPYAPDGYIVEVQNREGQKANSYWLRAEKKDGEQTGSKVRWVESLAQGQLKGMDTKTLPHVLVSEADGTFTFKKGEWEERKVGDDTTNPFPSFVDGQIKSIGIFQNRLLQTSGEAAIMARTNRFFDFFRGSTQVISDDDPIDVFADANEINNLMHHAVLDGDIVFFAENGQFIIKGDKPITSANVILRKATSFPINVLASPAITGESIMIPFDNGHFTGIRELFTDSYTDTKRARPITEHVAEYIQGKANRLVSSPNINTLVIHTPTDLSEVYVYDWLWQGDNRVQAAFHKWKVEGEVLFSKFVVDQLYFIIRRRDGIHLEMLPISSDEPDSGLDFPVRLDQRAVVKAKWQNFRWEFTLPYSVDDKRLELVRGAGCYEADRGTSVIFEKEGNTYFTYDDLADWQNGVLECSLTAGTKFMSRYIPTKPFLKDQNGRVLGLDRFTLGRVTLNYESIGETTVYIYDKQSRRKWRYQHNGRVFGGWNNRVGFAPLDSGKFPFPVRLPSENATITIETEDYRPFVLRDMEWEGMFKQSGRRF